MQVIYLIWIPKYRQKVLYGHVRRYLTDVLHELARPRESKIHKGHLRGDPVHMFISIPPKYSVSQVVGYMKGKSAIHIARNYSGRKRNFTGQSFWARGYYVSTVGRDEEAIREYIRRHESLDKKFDSPSVSITLLTSMAVNSHNER